MEKDGVLVVGSANMDLVAFTGRYPKPGETIFGKKFQMFPGGKGANQAVASSKLGIPTFLLAKVGQDEFGDKLKETMRVAGVNLDHLLIDKNESTGIAFIIVDENGQNEIIVISGSNMNLIPDDINVKKEIFSKVKIVLCQLEVPIETVEAAARISKETGSLFILNPAPANKLPEELYSCIDYLTPNEIELEILSGISVKDLDSAEKAAKVLISRGTGNVLITLGNQGALLVNKNETKMFPAEKVQAKDTTAAGDAFNGAVAFSLAQDKNIYEAIEFANRVAAISVTRMGAQSSMPSYEEVNSFN